MDKISPTLFLVVGAVLNNHITTGAVPVFVAPDPLGTTVLTIAENTAVGTTIYTLSATDADNDPLTYGKFTGIGFNVVAPDSVVTTQTFSIAVQSVHSITVSVSDGSSTTYISMSISLTPAVAANANSPIFLPTIYATNIQENTASGTIVQALTCSDVESTTCTLAIQSGDDASNKFTISGNDLQTTSTPIDYDTMSGQSFLYTLVITGVDTPDTPSSAKTASATVYVTVTSQNDNTPSISGPPTATVSESSAAGTTVCTMTASDSDYGDDGTLSYSIVGGNTDGLFGITYSSGKVYLAGTLDYEVSQSHELTIKVSDGSDSMETATSTVRITVTDVNDNPPTCSSPPYVFSVNEQTSATRALVMTLACGDADSGTSLQYAITSGNSDSCFDLDPSTGDLSTACTLDYDTGSQKYALVTTVTDSTFTSTVTIFVNLDPVNENTPDFGSSTTVTIPESTSPGTSILTYTASDADASPHGITKYEIASVTRGGSSLFTIDMTSAVIYLSQSVDFETVQDSYVIKVKATDGGSLTGTGTVTVSVTDVNDNTPSCTPATHVISVAENAALNFVVIADLSCSDGDAGTTLVYTLTPQPGTNLFSVSETGGVASLFLNGALDYETTSFHELTISVSDGLTSATVSVNINVVDVQEGLVFNPVTYTVSCSESTPINTVLTTVTATSADTITYSFVTSYAGFTIDSTAGTVSLVTSLDYDTTPSHTLLIQADAGGLSATATVIITVTVVDESSSSTSSSSSSSSSSTSTSTCTPFYETVTGISVLAGAGVAALIGVGTLTTGIIKLRKVSSLTSGSAKLTKVGKVADKKPIRAQAWTSKTPKVNPFTGKIMKNSLPPQF